MESALILAQVKSVQGQTCTVIINNTLELTDVRLRAVQDNQETGLLITPTVGSYVMITDLSNSNKTDFAVIMYSQIDKIEINKGKNGGLINIKELITQLNTIQDDINQLKNAITAWTPVPEDGGAALKTATAAWAEQQINKTKQADIEDTKITH